MPLRFKKLVKEMMDKKGAGPSPKFSIFHILRAIEIIAEKIVGRSKLAEELEVGEGSVRTMISRLKDAGIITTSKRGCILTRKGRELWGEYKTVFGGKMELGKSELTLGDHNLAILVKDRGHKVKSGMEQRDAAVMVGAGGATTIIFKGRRLTIPSVSDNLAEDFPKSANQIIDLLDPEENDVIVIGSADSHVKAEYAALAAAWTLLDNSH